MRDRVKVIQTAAADLAMHPLVPASVRGAVAELAALAGELVAAAEVQNRTLASLTATCDAQQTVSDSHSARIETLERYSDRVHP